MSYAHSATLGAIALASACLGTNAIAADWAPTKPVEFVVTAGAGGGTDIFTRTIQSVIQKNNLINQPIVVTLKGGGSGAEGGGGWRAARD